MKKRSLGAITGAAVVATTAAIGASALQSPSPASATSAVSAQTLELLASPASGGMIDSGKRGPTPGDSFYERGTLKDTSGHPQGSLVISGELIAGNGRSGVEQTTSTLLLPGGQITLAGAHGEVDDFSLAVTGGTGAYAGASGSVALSSGPRNTQKLVVQIGS